MGELYDPEFEEAMADLVHEASAVAEERFAIRDRDPRGGATRGRARRARLPRAAGS